MSAILPAAPRLVTKRVCLTFVGHDQRMFPYVDHVAWAARQVPAMSVTGPIPLPRSQFRRSVLSSPFKFGSARETWEKTRCVCCSFFFFCNVLPSFLPAIVG